ncbi:unnamed protein product [Closterium sp. NIES-54]
MEFSRTSMIHTAAPHFLWPFAVRYAAHQLNLWPCVSEPETSPTLRWTKKVGDASIIQVWGALSLVRDAKVSKLSSRTLRWVFLGFPTDAPPWQFYHPRESRVFSFHDVTFDKSVCFSGVSQVDPPSLVEPLEISSDSSGPAEGGDPVADNTTATRRSLRLETSPGFLPRLSSPPPQPAAADSKAEIAGAEPGGAELEGEGYRGAAIGGAGFGGAATGGAESGGHGGRDRGDRGHRGGRGGEGRRGHRGGRGSRGVRGRRGRGDHDRGAGAGGAASARGATRAAGNGGAGAAGTGGAGAAGTGGASTRGAGAAGACGADGAGGATGAAGSGGAGGATGARGARAGGTGGTRGAGAGGPGGAHTIGAGAAGADGAACGDSLYNGSELDYGVGTNYSD